MSKVHYEEILPGDIEKRSFEMISRELGERRLKAENETVIKRVIHTTADFDYVDTLAFSPHVVNNTVEILRQGGVTLVTDTRMAFSGISKPALAKLGGQIHCFMSDEDVARMAKQQGTTRAVASMDKACMLSGNLIFAIGNAPTALIRLYELIGENRIKPRLIIGVPVGFVNVVEAKELIMQTEIPYIVARGRKGGSNVAAAIVNALLYQATGRTL